MNTDLSDVIRDPYIWGAVLLNLVFWSSPWWYFTLRPDKTEPETFEERMPELPE